MVPDSVLKSVMTAALHQGTLISFRRVSQFCTSGPASRDKSNPARTHVEKTKEQPKEEFESKLDPPVDPPSPSNDGSKPKASEPSFDRQTHLHRIFGVDLTQVPGINVLTAQTLLAEIGPDFSRFPSGPEFASWLGLCSDNRVSGGKVLSVKTRKVKNRAATALRMAALSVHRSQSFLGHFYRRMRAKLGAPKAITATAHKLARILYHMVTTRHAYDETICAQNEVQNRQRMEARLRKQARALGLQVVAL